MQHKETIKNFVKALTEYIKNSMNGTVVLMGDNDGWGKLIIENAQIVSINYGIFRGMQVLPELEKLKEIRFMFRPAKKDDGKGTDGYVSAGSARINNEEFFSYFGVAVPRENSSTGNGNVPSYQKTSNEILQEKILIIDDSSIARTAAARPLAEYGYKIIEAKDGFEALGMLDKEVPDLIVLDLIMPGIDGYKVVDLLKGNEKFKNLPIIMVTSKDSLMDKLKGKMSPTDAYITKPFKDAELLNKVIDILQ